MPPVARDPWVREGARGGQPPGGRQVGQGLHVHARPCRLWAIHQAGNNDHRTVDRHEPSKRVSGHPASERRGAPGCDRFHPPRRVHLRGESAAGAAGRREGRRNRRQRRRGQAAQAGADPHVRDGHREVHDPGRVRAVARRQRAGSHAGGERGPVGGGRRGGGRRGGTERHGTAARLVLRRITRHAAGLQDVRRLRGGLHPRGAPRRVLLLDVHGRGQVVEAAPVQIFAERTLFQIKKRAALHSYGPRSFDPHSC